MACLARALSDADEEVRRRAVESLQRINDPAAVGALIAAAFGAHPPLARLAEQALAASTMPEASAVLRLKDILTRNDWAALSDLGEAGRLPLQVILNSQQYAAWPSAKRKQVLSAAVQLGVRLPPRHSRELARMGMFTSGVHTVGDLLTGLRSRNPDVRSAAAEKMADSGQRWAAFLMYNRFKREQKPGGDRGVAVALARAMERLDDLRPVEDTRRQLYEGEGVQAAEAARMLAEIGTQHTLETLFWFIAEPPPPPAYRNVPLATNALAGTGPAAVEALRPLAAHESEAVRRLMVDVITRSGHSASIDMLRDLGRDTSERVSRAAVEALGGLNTAAAAAALVDLLEDVPREWIVHTLVSVTQPEALEHLRRIQPEVTTLEGVLLGDDRKPLAGAQVQMMHEYYYGELVGWGWKAASARARTDESGAFSLSLLAYYDEVIYRLKIVLPGSNRKAPETFMADIALAAGSANQAKIRIDRFFDRLMIEVGQPREVE